MLSSELGSDDSEGSGVETLVLLGACFETTKSGDDCATESLDSRFEAF